MIGRFHQQQAAHYAAELSGVLKDESLLRGFLGQHLQVTRGRAGYHVCNFKLGK